MGWNPVCVQHIDWRPYAGQTVLVGELMHPDGQQRPASVLGVVRPERHRSPHVAGARRTIRRVTRPQVLRAYT
jgi:hypothetical protein